MTTFEIVLDNEDAADSTDKPWSAVITKGPALSGIGATPGEALVDLGQDLDLAILRGLVPLGFREEL